MNAADVDYQAFVNWAKANQHRNVRIEIDKTDQVNIIVGQWFATDPRDYCCQIVDSVDEIDLLSKLVSQQDADFKRKQRAFDVARQALERIHVFTENRGLK